MANISKLAKYQSSAVCLAGVSAAVWIIVYGKISHSRRRFVFLYFVHSPIKWMFINSNCQKF